MRKLLLTAILTASIAALHAPLTDVVRAGAPEPEPESAAEIPPAEPAPATALESEEEESWARSFIPSLKLAGAVSFGEDFNDPHPDSANAKLGVYSSFDSPGFHLDLIQAEISDAWKWVGYSTKVDFGQLARVAGDSGNRDRDLIFTDPSGEWEITLQEAYIYGDLQPFVVTVGRFASPIGYEVLEPWGNANITRSRAWLEQPISFDGFSAAVSFWDINLSLAAVNSLFKDDEYDQFRRYQGNRFVCPVEDRDRDGECITWNPDLNIPVDFNDVVHESDNEWGAVFSIGSRVLETDISLAGFYGQVDEALDSTLLKVFATEPTDKLILNLVIARSFGRFSLALEGNLVWFDKTRKVSFIEDDPENNPNFWIQDYPSERVDASTTGNGVVYLGVSFLEKGSLNLRGDCGVYDDAFRQRTATQWSVTTTAAWQFNDYVGARIEYRYDGVSPDAPFYDLFVKDDGDFSDSIHLLHAQVLVSWKPL
ncbi:MAG TPA: outer membrane beta-barrel protein [Candidatus Binatia bacterium]|nr:outer membrane beta-barrel protein [Candidatus Binatia bacterium]